MVKIVTVSLFFWENASYSRFYTILVMRQEQPCYAMVIAECFNIGNVSFAGLLSQAQEKVESISFQVSKP